MSIVRAINFAFSSCAVTAPNAFSLQVAQACWLRVHVKAGNT